jgi:hypothetical protein
MLAGEKNMSNIIYIEEKHNRLDFADTYTPVVCGNSNYYVKFKFSSDWLGCYKKTAVFIVDGVSKQMPFEGDLLRLPAFPNASCFQLMLYVKDDNDELYSTTALKIRLEPTPIGHLVKFKFRDY